MSYIMALKSVTRVPYCMYILHIYNKPVLVIYCCYKCTVIDLLNTPTQNFHNMSLPKIM